AGFGSGTAPFVSRCLLTRVIVPHALDFSGRERARLWHSRYFRNAMTRHIQFEGRPVWAEVSLGALLHNLKVIRRHIGKERKILAVVKANAYGLGAVPISKALAKAGA